jgi:hypothetical protein
MRARSRVLTLTAIVAAVALVVVFRSLPTSASAALVPVSAESGVVAMTTSTPVVAHTVPMPGLPKVSDRTKLIAMGSVLFGLAAAVRRTAQ